MKVAILGESGIDEGVLDILTGAILGQPIEPIQLSHFRHAGWPDLLGQIPAVLKYLHYVTDAQGLVIGADSDESSLDTDPPQRIDEIRRQVRKVREELAKRDGLRVRVAIGLAVPAIEAWLLCGSAVRHDLGENHWRSFLAGRPSPQECRKIKLELKAALYGNERAPSLVRQRRTREHANRIAQNIPMLMQWFPRGFGSLVQDLEGWKT